MMGKASVSQPVCRWTKNEWIVLKSTINTQTHEKGKSHTCMLLAQQSVYTGLYNYFLLMNCQFLS